MWIQLSPLKCSGSRLWIETSNRNWTLNMVSLQRCDPVIKLVDRLRKISRRENQKYIYIDLMKKVNICAMCCANCAFLSNCKYIQKFQTCDVNRKKRFRIRWIDRCFAFCYKRLHCLLNKTHLLSWNENKLK